MNFVVHLLQVKQLFSFTLCAKVLIQSIVRRLLLAKWAGTAPSWVCDLTLAQPPVRQHHVEQRMIFQPVPHCCRHL